MCCVGKAFEQNAHLTQGSMAGHNNRPTWTTTDAFIFRGFIHSEEDLRH